MQTKRPVFGAIKVRVYPALCRAVEEGVAYGWRRAHKYVDTPDEETIKERIVTAVLSEISEYFDFNDDAETQ
jgi:hypothetical protein